MKRSILALALASIFPLSGVALAQQSPSPNSPGPTSTAEDNGQLNSVVVTARRREELLQDVPGAVSAFSAEGLTKSGITDITGLADFVPNTTLKAARGTNTTLTAFIRGVGQQDPVAGYEGGVGIYLDDIYLARPQGAVMDIYDVERIEVLRGPQGTLYGRNTIGGAVKYVTRKLAPEAEARIKATMGDYGERDVVVTMSSPVSDSLRLGGTVASMNRNGFGKNVVTGEDNYNKKILAGRFSAEITPASNLFIRFAADCTTDTSAAKSGYRLTNGPAAEPTAPLAGDYDTRAGLNTVNGNPQQVTTSGQSLLVEYYINDQLVVKSITAERRSETYAPIDFDSLQGTFMDVPAVYTDKQFSQELQFAYTGKKFQGVAGVYMLNANAYNKFDVWIPGVSVFTSGDMDTKAWAAYFDSSYNISDALSLSAGARYTNDQRDARVVRQLYLGKGSPELGGTPRAPFTTDTDVNLSRTDTKFTPKLGFGWKLAPEHNVYGSYAEGFKGGMFDPRMNLSPTARLPAVAPATVGELENTPAIVAAKRAGASPEEITTWELGFKSRWLKGQMQTNVAVFTSDYKNVQIPGSRVAIGATGPTFSGYLRNAGKAAINGFELETVARLTPALSVSAMVGYIDARYTELLDESGKDISGTAKFQNTPQNSANLSATYDWAVPLFGKNGTLGLTNSVSYKSAIQQFEFAIPLLDQDAYSLWDASLIWTSKDRKIQAGLHAKNLNDQRYKVAGYNFPGFSNTVTAFYGAPRTLNATVELRF